MRSLLASLRSALSLLAVLLWLCGPGALILYAGVIPAGWLMPARRRALVSAYMRLMSRVFLGLLRLGGARFERSGVIPTDAPVLILGNHQSLLDIVSLTLLCWPHAPAFVTRLRYSRLVPAVSTCVRLIGSPIVEPRRQSREAVARLREMAPGLRHGLVLFPEGHRTRDGEVRPFKSAGAQAVLEGQPMPVWVVVTDGFWASRRLVDFIFNIRRIHGRTQVLGRFDPPAAAQVPDFLDTVRERIVQRLQEMRGGHELTPKAVLSAVRAHACQEAGQGEAAAAAKALAEAAAGEVEGIVFFGSRRSGARPEATSAYDFFVVARQEKPLYNALARAGLLRRRPALLAAVGRLLPPTSISLTLPGPSGPLLAKCAVVTRSVFERETSAGRRDHFFLGRLFQPASVVYARDTSAREALVQALARAHTLAYRWGRPWLPPRFGAAEFARTLLRVSYAGEIRPEPVERRVDTLWQAQQGYLSEVYGVLLRELAVQGELRETGEGTYELARPLGRWERWRLFAYFRWSMLRATARWAKHVVSFEGWLDFLLRKARRHTGQEIVLTERERRAPLIFLWPRVWRYLREKDR